MEDPARAPPPPFAVHLVTGGSSSLDLSHLLQSLAAARIVAFDAEWKPRRRRAPANGDDASPAPPNPPQLPTVTVLQLACRSEDGANEVFVVDLLAVPLADLWAQLRDLFERPEVLKLGFRFKQDLVYLSATFTAALGCDYGFQKVEPFLDVTNVYYYLKGHDRLKRLPKETKSLATICEELLNVSLSKELQCSDWSCRPLSEGQIRYAASDAYYLLDIFDLFQQKVSTEEKCSPTTDLNSDEFCSPTVVECSSSGYSIYSAGYLASIIAKYSEGILLTESDTKARSSRRKEKQKLPTDAKYKEKFDCSIEWQGPPPWDQSIGGDGLPKFLCDVMIEGLAKHLRCVGIDAATPSCRKPQPRELLNQIYKEGRILLTRDMKLLKYQYLATNQVYKVKSLLKRDQLAEVIDTFQLKISEDRLMSRCTKCNGSFIQKPLTLDEAMEASKGFQVIPSCIFNRDLEFWKCTDCNQLYWEGTQYHNAVQKFMSVCNISE
ncbi:exonuclease mut-7 homolog isoform X2 [Lolium rigidum]|uniref:exonuclease mut-7 homolog isoform X2 n=1 Tax=Lolium rigidum TaxID=89674 RepID=UPI001F5CA151|nr:exonuclease mut-7 homolog isoform X2 [Lolium rigidum]